MLRVGLTGNIASGKSAVADVWRRMGASIIDADELARVAAAPGSAGLRGIVARFGESVLRPDGTLDREALRARVFADPEERVALERILHPEIARLRELEEARIERSGARVAVHVVPLLFEAGLARGFDLVVLVDAPESARLERIVRDRGLPEGEARRMIGAQMPAREKRSRSDIVIENGGTLAELEATAASVWRKIEERAG